MNYLTDVYGLKPEVWGRVGPDPRAELQVDLEILHFVLHHPNRRTVIRLTHHIMANRDIIGHLILVHSKNFEMNENVN